MKKIIISILIGLSLLAIGCSVDCGSKPPKRAIKHKSGGMNMQYHFTIYVPGRGVQHSAKCAPWTYGPIEIYSDNLGALLGDEVLWNNIYGEVSFVDNGVDPHNIKLNLSETQISIQGMGNQHDGTYKVEITSPDSWGVPIDRN